MFPLLACGCVIPIPTPEWGDQPITREQFDAIERGAGTLTRDEVESMLGSPQQNYAGGRVVLYTWTRRDFPRDAASVADVPDDFVPKDVGDRSAIIAKISEVVPKLISPIRHGASLTAKIGQSK